MTGNSHFELGEYKKSISCCEKIKEVEPKNKGSQELLEKAKKSIKGKLSFRFESPKEILRQALLEITFRGKPRGYEETLEEINPISIEEIEKAVDRYLSPERILKVALVPKD